MTVGDRARVLDSHPRLAGRTVRIRDLWGTGPILASVQTVDHPDERPLWDWVAVANLKPLSSTGDRPNGEDDRPREHEQETEHE